MKVAAEPVVAECLKLVQPAESAFRSRWRLSTLKRLDADLHGLLVEQIDLYNTALVTGSEQEARTQAAAMVRGWRAACALMEAPLQPDVAYLTGVDWSSGCRVVISDQRTSVARVQSVNGERVVIVTPDEVAKLIGGMAIIAEAKNLFPDAEILSVQSNAAVTCGFKGGDE